MTDENGSIPETKLISKHEFYFGISLYKLIKYSELEDVDNLLIGDVDAYSVANHTDTTYNISFKWIQKLDTEYGSPHSEYYSGFGIVTLACKRKDNDILRFFVYNDQINRWVMKVGQLPSLADLQFAEIENKYNKVLPKDDLKNLKRAVGLVAHGVGAGSFVYLRKIFENLIYKTYSDNMTAVGIPEIDFKKQRMMDKVETLKKFLPSQLVEMKNIYTILSKGVHELAEEECLRYFSPIKLSIELILDQKIEESNKREKDLIVKKQLQMIHRQIITNSEDKNETIPL